MAHMFLGQNMQPLLYALPLSPFALASLQPGVGIGRNVVLGDPGFANRREQLIDTASLPDAKIGDFLPQFGPALGHRLHRPLQERTGGARLL